MVPWLINHFRLSYFSTDDSPVVNSEGLFKDITGLDPELDEKRSQLKTRRRALATEAHRHEIIEGPRRLDYTKLGRLNLEVASMGDMQDALLCNLNALDQQVLNVANQLFSRVSNVIRVALGGIMYFPVVGPSEGYAILQKCIPTLDLSFERSTDFNMQINRPRRVTNANNLKLNRLCTWVVGTGATVGSDGFKIVGQNWAQVFFDINTATENVNVFDNETYDVILVEKLKAAKEISFGFNPNGL